MAWRLAQLWLLVAQPQIFRPLCIIFAHFSKPPTFVTLTLVLLYYGSVRHLLAIRFLRTELHDPFETELHGSFKAELLGSFETELCGSLAT